MVSALFSNGYLLHLILLLRERGFEPGNAAQMQAVVGVAMLLGRISTGLALDAVLRAARRFRNVRHLRVGLRAPLANGTGVDRGSPPLQSASPLARNSTYSPTLFPATSAWSSLGGSMGWPTECS